MTGVEIDFLQRLFERLDDRAGRVRPGFVDEACPVGIRTDDFSRIVFLGQRHDFVVHAADISHTRDAAGDVEHAVRQREMCMHVPETGHE